MADNENKMISIEKMDEIMNDYFPAQAVLDYHGQELVVKRLIPFELFCEIVNGIATACFNPDTGDYMPECLDMSLRSCIIAAYTNIQLPETLEERYRVAYGSDLMDIVMDSIDSGQLRAMRNAIDVRIRTRCDANKAAFDHAVQAVMESVDQIGQQIQSVFGDVTREDIQNLIRAIGTDGIDEEKLVQAVVAERNRTRGDNVVQFPAEPEQNT